MASQIHTLQKYRDDSASKLGWAFLPARVKRDNEENIEITRGVYSAAKLGESANEPDTPHHNYLPRNA